MVFSSLTFLFIFLPLALFIYYVCPRKFKNLALMLVSLVFYAWGEPKYIAIMIFSSVFDYVNGLLIGKFKAKDKKIGQRIVLIVSVLGNLAILGTFKYAGGLLGLALPIGISFYTFQTMSYTIDVYRGQVKPQHNFIDFAAYVCMFPQLIAGPIVRYATVEKQLRERVHSIDKFASGIRRFIIGLGKKVILANMVGKLWEYASAHTYSGASVTLAWLGAIAYTFQIYFDFSGYSDMAIGLGKMFGFDYDENFDYPYMEKSVTGFWRKWHISLGTWFREYVYIPLGGNRKGIGRQLLNILIVWALTGIWHGASWNFMVWGLYYGFFLAMEKLFMGKLLKKAPKIIGHIYMMLLVIVGWVIFAIEDFHKMGRYLANMFGGATFINNLTAYSFFKYVGVLFLCVLGCTNIVKRSAAHIMSGTKPAIRAVVSNLVLLAIMLLSVALVVGDSYNPFLYFRF